MPQQLTFSYPSSETSGRPRRRIRDLPAEERPLYRLHQVGADGLATTELLALVLGTADAPGLATELLARFHSLHQLARASKIQLMRVHGIGEAQAGRLLAVLELCRRLQSPPADERPRITSPAEAARLLTPRLIVTWNILSATIYLLRRMFHERYLLGTISPVGRVWTREEVVDNPTQFGAGSKHY